MSTKIIVKKTNIKCIRYIIVVTDKKQLREVLTEASLRDQEK